ncbi:unnamed protein product, partial [Ectocarpus fasciculatus]
RSSPRADRVGGQKKRRGAGAATPASTVFGPTAPASGKPPIAPPPMRRPQHARKPAFGGFPATPSPATTAGPTTRPSVLNSPSVRRAGGARGAAAAGASASTSAVGPAVVVAATGATGATGVTGVTAVMPPTAASLPAAVAVMPAAVPSGRLSYGSLAVAVNAAVAAAAATAVRPPPTPPGQLFGAPTSLPFLFQSQALARDEMDVDPSKSERVSTAKAMMANALASVAQVKLNLAGRAVTKAEEEARVLQSVIADADLARAVAAMEELREAEWAANRMDVDDEDDFEGPWPMEVDG